MAQTTTPTDDFIRKDVFDARMDRMEMLLEKTLTEIKADNENLRNDMKTEIARLETKIEKEVARLETKIEKEVTGLRNEMRENNARLETKIEVATTRIDALQTWQYWELAWMGIIIAALTLLPAIVRYIDKKGEAAANKARILLGGHLADKDMR